MKTSTIELSGVTFLKIREKTLNLVFVLESVIYLYLVMFSFFYVLSDFDECSLEPNPCGDNTDCTNTEGSYSCSCKKGFTGNVLACKGMCSLTVFKQLGLGLGLGLLLGSKQ